VADKTPEKPVAQNMRLVKFGASDTFNQSNKLPNEGSESTTIVSNAALPEDEFQNYYMGGSNDHGIIVPPWDMRRLEYLVNENNALAPCIDAMEVNVDGTGFEFKSQDPEAEDEADDAQIAALKEFFDQPWPGMSFITLRRLLRRDLERTGNAFMEVVRDNGGKIVFLRHVDAKMVRIVKLDQAIPVKKRLVRNGVEVTHTVLERQRRYVQLLNGLNLFYFKEFGTERDLNKRTGTWANEGAKLPGKDRATEMMHFVVQEDVHTPYGVPRWIAQMPSLVGSRLAEEFNVEFFNSGGLPPALVILQGGVLGHETRKAMELNNGQMAFKKQRLQILEVEPSGGTIDTSPQARVLVERFGAERQADSMFEEYDARCEIRIRRAFRLPPIFVGAAEDYSFATAFASYKVAEAQVFKPERDEFDEMMTQRLLPAMGFDGYKMVSNPLNIEDATLQLQGIEIAMATGVVSETDVLDEINTSVGLTLKADEKKVAQMEEQADAAHEMALNPPIDPLTGLPMTMPGKPGLPGAGGVGSPMPKGMIGKPNGIKPPTGPGMPPNGGKANSGMGKGKVSAGSTSFGKKTTGTGTPKSGFSKEDLADDGELTHLEKFNHFHAPAGNEHGGEFTSGEGVEFISPNTGNLDFEGANKALASAKHKKLRKAFQEIDEAVGIHGMLSNVIGAWADGAENSLMTRVKGASWEQLVTAGAMKGFLANQKQVLVFKEGDGDDSFIASFDAKGSLKEVHQHLLDNGLPFHTLEPTGNGVRVHVFGMDDETADAVFAAGKHFKSDITSHVGKGEFLGTTKEDGTDAEQRADARKIYESQIGKFGDQGAHAKWAGIRHSYGGTQGFLKQEDLKALGFDIMSALRKRDYVTVAKGLHLSAQLPPEQQAEFNGMLAEFSYLDPSVSGLDQLAAATANVLAAAE